MGLECVLNHVGANIRNHLVERHVSANSIVALVSDICCMTRILCIDTSGPVCTVLLANNGMVEWVRQYPGPNDHAAYLHLAIQEIWTKQGGVDAVAVCSGPGSYTGLRIGVSAAKGLCYAGNLPLLAIPTLRLMAESVRLMDVRSDYIVPMLDARRDEVYLGVFYTDGSQLSPDEAHILSENSLSDWRSKGTLTLTGSGAEKAIRILGTERISQVEVDAETHLRAFAAMAQSTYDTRRFEDVAYFEPEYLKPFFFTSSKKL